MIARTEVGCHVCHAATVEEISSFSNLRRVASDCQPWPAGGTLGVCPSCGAVQKLVDKIWRDEARAIYENYRIYHQAVGDAEQAVFEQGSGVATPRSRRILETVIDATVLAGRGRMLDVGCGNGAMLRAFSVLAPDWALYGQEPNVKSAESLRAVHGVKEVYACAVDQIPQAFDLITLIHALEHIEDPRAFLATLARKLNSDGRVLIEVPYFPDNPFDLLIADHCTHFTLRTLRDTLENAGLEIVEMRTDVVTKEITAVAKRSQLGAAHSDGPSLPLLSDAQRMIQDALEWLELLLSDARNVSGARNFGLFGTSISANWLLVELVDRVKFFIDEDPSRVGTTYHGLPVLHPKDAPRDSDIYMVLPRALAENIVARLISTSARYHLSPEYRKTRDEVAYVSHDVEA